ncbi:hypothetical protein ACYZT4_04040 [Pseudomonas sp. GB2N2]
MKRQALLAIAFSVLALNVFAANQNDPLFSDAVAANQNDPLFSDAVAESGSDRLIERRAV